MKTNILHQVDVNAAIESFPDSSIDMILTSPPYDDLRTYDELVTWSMAQFRGLAPQLARILKPGGVMVWNVGDQTVNGSETGNSFRQALYFTDHCGLRLHDTMIWQKSNFSNPSRTRYHQVFDYVFVLSKGAPKTFNPICDRRNVYGGRPGSFGENTVTQRDGSKLIRPRKVNTEYGMRHNVWVTNTAGQDRSARKWGHPAMFSMDFARDHIQSWSNPGDVVFDPFGGSGTTALAAKELGRDWIMCEINPDYCETIKQRLELTDDQIHTG